MFETEECTHEIETTNHEDVEHITSNFRGTFAFQHFLNIINAIVRGLQARS
jgi:hypothetical protein